MNTLQSILVKHYPEIRKPSAMFACELAVIRFLFSLDSLQVFIDRMGEFTDTSTLKLRRELNSNGYLLKNVKLFMYDASRGAWQHSEYARRVADRYDIRPEDISIARLLYHDEELRTDLFELTKVNDPISLEGFDDLISHCTSEIMTYATKYVYRKLRFIFQAEHMEPEDFVMDIMGECIMSLMHQYPRIDGTLHAVNVFKAVVKNRGNNIIKRYTSESRATLVKNPDGTFSSLKCSYEGLVEAMGNVVSDEAEVFGSTTNDRTDLKLTVTQLLERYTGKRNQFLRLLHLPDTGFTLWLRERGAVSETHDNEDLSDKMVQKGNFLDYMNMCLDYLSVPRTKGHAFIRHLRSELGHSM